MNKAMIIKCLIVTIFLLTLSGCAFDVIHVKQEPAQLVSVEPSKVSWVLVKTAIIELGTGYKRKLKAGTTWDYAGSIKQGEVYKTDDQILTIEGSNIFEAYIVVSESDLVGFYLPVEGTFSPISSPVKLEIKRTGEN
jgi:hypothetical protein